jgi:hypothetical protein
MKAEDQAKVVELLRESRDRSRGYADFFLWAANRDLEEWGVVVTLAESLAAGGDPFFRDVKSRGRPNDPPDCEARDSQGRRIAIEVTELVDSLAIREYKKSLAEHRPTDWAEWEREKFVSLVVARLEGKDKRFPQLKGTPYPGGYVVVVHSDEPGLSKEVVAKYLGERFVLNAQHISRAFLLLSYDPSVQMCPYFELPVGA